MTLTAPYEPVELTAVERAFPANALDWMPAPDDIPETYWNSYEWHTQLWRDAMFAGIDDIQLAPKDPSWEQEEVDRAHAHLYAILGSFAPKHQHKEAALAYLTDQWFDAVRWKRKGEDEWRSTPDVEWP